MNLFVLAAAVLYIGAGLFAKGWIVTASMPNAILCIAAGLLFTLIAGYEPLVRSLRRP